MILAIDRMMNSVSVRGKEKKDQSLQDKGSILYNEQTRLKSIDHSKLTPKESKKLTTIGEELKETGEKYKENKTKLKLGKLEKEHLAKEENNDDPDSAKLQKNKVILKQRLQKIQDLETGDEKGHLSEKDKQKLEKIRKESLKKITEIEVKERFNQTRKLKKQIDKMLDSKDELELQLEELPDSDLKAKTLKNQIEQLEKDINEIHNKTSETIKGVRQKTKQLDKEIRGSKILEKQANSDEERKKQESITAKLQNEFYLNSQISRFLGSLFPEFPTGEEMDQYSDKEIDRIKEEIGSLEEKLRKNARKKGKIESKKQEQWGNSDDTGDNNRRRRQQLMGDYFVDPIKDAAEKHINKIAQQRGTLSKRDEELMQKADQKIIDQLKKLRAQLRKLEPQSP